MKRAPNQPVTGQLVIYAGIYCKIYHVPDAGTILPQHAHSFDHVTMLMQGAVYVEQDGVPAGRYDAPAVIQVQAKIKHSFTTLGPQTVLACLHNADALEDDGEPMIDEEHHLVTED